MGGARQRPRRGGDERAEASEHRERAAADLCRRRRGAVRVHGESLVALVLAIEPDHRQATTSSASSARSSKPISCWSIRATPPSRRSTARFRTSSSSRRCCRRATRRSSSPTCAPLDGAEHLQTHTIPQLAGSRSEPETREQRRRAAGQVPQEERSRSRTSAAIRSSSPKEIRTFLARAAQMKAEAVQWRSQNRVAQLEAQVDDPGAHAQGRAGRPRVRGVE